MRVTLKEIAREAGVHISTVDKVLHHRAGVSDSVREKVQRIIDEKGYVPNQAGSALQKAGNHYRIHVILQQVDAADYLQKGIEDWIRTNREYNLDAEIHRTCFQDIGRQTELIRSAADNADGIILFPNNSEDVRQAINRVVTVNSDIEGSARICHVGQNGYRTACMAGRMMGMLLGGAGNVAVITSSVDTENNDYHVKIRETVFSEFLEKHYPGIRITGRVENFENAHIAYEKSKKLILSQPDLDGIYITCGGVSMVCRALLDTKTAHRIKVISFESYPEIVEMMNDDVVDCTIGSNLLKQGSTSIRALTEYLIYRKKPPERIFIDSRILVKECFPQTGQME